jgi:opacity protein-like surface antigen
MSLKTSVLLAAAAVMVLPAGLVQAADYEPPVFVDQPVEEYVPVEVGSGWYLRGDVGYNFSAEAKGDFDYRTFDALTGTYGAAIFDTASLGNNVTVGFGFGYNFTDYLRADLTFDAFRTSFDGTTFSSLPCSGAPAFIGTSCRSEDSADATAYSLMANSYVDLGTYVGFTPYVGGGLGMTYVDWDSLHSSAFCVGATCPPPGAFLSGTESDGEKSWRFTWALMAGMAYDLTRNLKVDLGYRYRSIDGGPMFAFDPGSQLAGATGTQGEDPGFQTHEVRIGLRYSLW